MLMHDYVFIIKYTWPCSIMQAYARPKYLQAFAWQYSIDALLDNISMNKLSMPLI